MANWHRFPLDTALAACQDLAPQFAHDDGAHGDDEMMLELADCLREQGLDVPDNLFEGGGVHDDVDKDELMAAMEECRDVVPWGGGQ